MASSTTSDAQKAPASHLTTLLNRHFGSAECLGRYVFGRAKEILKTALSPPLALPALTAHFLRFVAIVPHFPLPTTTNIPQ